MVDVFSSEERSRIMRLVKPAGNKSTEIRLIDLFKTFRITGWRRNYPILGKPDFVLPKSKTAIFVDGCFWHGHRCRNTTPKTNTDYWSNKIARNRARDRLVTRGLSRKGWRVVRVWECEIKRSEIPRKIRYLISNP